MPLPSQHGGSREQEYNILPADEEAQTQRGWRMPETPHWAGARWVLVNHSPCQDEIKGELGSSEGPAGRAEGQ